MARAVWARRSRAPEPSFARPRVLDRSGANPTPSPPAAVGPGHGQERDGGDGGIRKVFFTYSMLARVSATTSPDGELVSSTYQPLYPMS